MSSITAIFGNSADKSPRDDERLMDLYWNRNELKKEFAGLRNEKFKLTDRLKAQQGDLARLQQKLDQLEELLIDPEWTRSIMVLYQLRGLGRLCTKRVARFAEQIKQQREKKLNGQARARWQADLDREVAELEAGIKDLDEQAFRLEADLHEARANVAESSGLMRLFRRRSINRRIEQLSGEIAELEAQRLARRAEIDSVVNREPPETVGLPLASKRSINFMILAYAQQLYVSFDDDDLVALVKEACDKSAGAIRYGSDRECEDMVARIRRSTGSLARGGDFAEVLQKRARLISEGAVYQNDDDAVPLPGSVATLFRIDAQDVVTTRDADLLGQNFWGLANVMSR